RLAISIVNSRVHHRFVVRIIGQQHRQQRSRQILFNVGDRHRHVPLLHFMCIVEVSYPHSKQCYRATKDGCQWFCNQISRPCQHHQGRCQQSEIELAGMPEIKDHPPCIRRRSSPFSRDARCPCL